MSSTDENVNSQEIFHSRINISAIQEKVSQIKSELTKIIVGQNQMADLIVAAILSNGHILIEGVPGVAKTLTAKIIAKTLDVGFSRIQFTPDLMPSDVTGTSIFNPKLSEFILHKGPVFSNIVLVDEINRAPAKTQSALFEVMEERQLTIDGITHKMDEPFIVIATQNPIEQEGTYRLPEAQIDRFLFKINVIYPTFQEEAQILKLKHEQIDHLNLSKITAVLSSEELNQLRAIVHSVIITNELIDYIIKIVQNTRQNKAIFLGASPRASIALMTSGKAFAAMNGRDFVTPEDIKYLATHVLRHRIILTPEKEMDGVHPDAVINDIIKGIEVPR
jgi:MoxR-like ATPase